MRQTKIVCTLGPATSSPERIRALAEAGMDVVRLNFSHGDHAGHAERFRCVRAVEKELGRPLSVLQDLSGPKLRIGLLPEEGVQLEQGARCLLKAEGDFVPGQVPEIPVPLPELLKALKPGNRVLLDDGNLQLTVLQGQGAGMLCEAGNDHLLRSRKGISAPGVPFEIAALTPKDMTDLDFGLDLGVDWVAVSFVRRAADLEPVRALCDARGTRIPVIPKIEMPEAVDHVDEILAASEGLMVARGDLGVEMPLFQVPLIQKAIIRRCLRLGKPVITATQMLESMTHNPRPTRAEVSDVANAVMDGTSAVMLSAETAVGEYPVEAVKTMDAIACHTEQHGEDSQGLRQMVMEALADDITDAISQGVAQIAHDLNVAAILCSTTSGFTARMVSRTLPRVPIIAATSNVATYHRLPLVRGVHPLLVRHTTSTDEMLSRTVQGAREAGWVKAGDIVVITLGAPVGTAGSTNLIKVQRI